jgi:lambda family phage portal protein
MTDAPIQLPLRWSPIDRVVEFFSPVAAQRRMAARIGLANHRAYDAAARGRGTDGWRSTGASADAEIMGARGLLRDRMRDLVRNNPMAAQAVQVLVNNIVGPGIRPRAASSNKTLNKRADKLWKAWAASCDAHGHTDFHGLTALAVRGMIEGGETLALKRLQPSRTGMLRRGQVPLRVELREGDHLDDGKMDVRASGARISQGIEFDADGNRTAYWMFPDHPGGVTQSFSQRHESVSVPAAMVAHLFERQRVQNRGVPWGVPAMRAMRDFDDWQNAELVRKKTEACLVGILLGDDDQNTSVGAVIEDSAGNKVEQFSPGMIGYGKNATDIRFNNPSAAGGTEEWTRVQQRIIAAGFRVPYALMTGDMSQANFSSARAGLNEFRRMIDQVQWQIVIPMFCDRIWGWFIEAAQLAGLLPVTAEIPAEWAPPRFESVNPLQDAQADLLEVRAGFASLQQKIAARGYDPAEITGEWQAMAQEMDDKGLIFDSDPRRTSKAGMPVAAPGQAPGQAKPTDTEEGDGTNDDGGDDTTPDATEQE